MNRIVQYPHPALRYPAQPVRLVDSEVRKVVGRLQELMFEHEGLGLAAPQIAVPLQIFVMNVEADPKKPELTRVVMNPVISEKSGNEERDEGCLSFPQLYQKVRRAKTCRLQGFDPDGNPIDLKLSNLEARVVLHETDHLHGKLFIDYFTTVGKLAARADLAEFETLFKRDQERGLLPSTKELRRQLQALEKQFGEGPGRAAM